MFGEIVINQGVLKLQAEKNFLTNLRKTQGHFHCITFTTKPLPICFFSISMCVENISTLRQERNSLKYCIQYQKVLFSNHTDYPAGFWDPISLEGGH